MNNLLKKIFSGSGEPRVSKKFKENGATILGGCCETNPSHIREIAKIK